MDGYSRKYHISIGGMYIYIWNAIIPVDTVPEVDPFKSTTSLDERVAEAGSTMTFDAWRSAQILHQIYVGDFAKLDNSHGVPKNWYQLPEEFLNHWCYWKKHIHPQLWEAVIFLDLHGVADRMMQVDGKASVD